MENYNSKAYRISRGAYIAQASFEYFVSILVADVYLSTLLTNLGINDGVIGVISSFISLAFLFQLGSIFVVQKIKNTKSFVITFSSASQLIFMGLYLIPFMNLPKEWNLAFVVMFILSAYFCTYIGASILFKWANSFVEPTNRGDYSAGKEIVSLLGGMIFTVFVGFMVDRFKDRGNIGGAFIFIAVAIFILSILNFVSLMLIKNRKNEVSEDTKIPIGEVIKNTFGNKPFLYVIILNCLWKISTYTTIGFLGTFKTKELLLSVGTVQLITVFSNLTRMAISKPFGKFSDKHSYAKGMKLGFAIEALGYVFCMFATRKSVWCMVLYMILYNCSLAGVNQNSFNITYNYVEDKYFVQAMAIKNSLSGVAGFVASIFAGKLLTHIQNSGNVFMGIHVFGQQVLAGISLVITVFIILFIHKVIEKQKAVIR